MKNKLDPMQSCESCGKRIIKQYWIDASNGSIGPFCRKHSKEACAFLSATETEYKLRVVDRPSLAIFPPSPDTSLSGIQLF